jgi:hypothetical protein
MIPSSQARDYDNEISMERSSFDDHTDGDENERIITWLRNFAAVTVYLSLPSLKVGSLSMSKR